MQFSPPNDPFHNPTHIRSLLDGERLHTLTDRLSETGWGRMAGVGGAEWGELVVLMENTGVKEAWTELGRSTLQDKHCTFWDQGRHPGMRYHPNDW